MHLSKLVLSGFKSFAEPLTMDLSKNLVGIVGPNGCGKSNIADAIRWVLGVGSAKSMRGGVMEDVIFSGSDSRPPADKALVELLFDNSDGALKSEFAGYKEISIRRELSRDGASKYFLNNSHCRKKDITDLFLGTGIGSRGYAIIQQGMVSRIVESNPQEVRTFLEEAAGISTFKERRRETELKIAHTQKNLDRVVDVRDELQSQLKKLDRQSKQALRHKKYQEKMKELKLSIACSLFLDTRSKKDVLHESYQSKLHEHAQLVEKNKHHTADCLTAEEVYDACKNKQQTMFASEQERNAQQQQLQQSYSFIQTQTQEKKQQIETAKKTISQLSSQYTKQEGKIQDIKKTRQQSDPDQQAIVNEYEEIQVTYNQEEQLIDDVQKQADTIKGEVQNSSYELQSLSQKKEHFRQQLDDYSDEYARQLELAKSQSEFMDVDAVARQLDESIKKANDYTRQKAGLITSRNALYKNINKQQESKQSLIEEIAILGALKIQGNEEEKATANTWLQESGLDKNSTLGDAIKAQEPYNLAVEMLFADSLSSIILTDYSEVSSHLPTLASGRIQFLINTDTGMRGKNGTLAEHVTAPASISNVLSRVIIANDIASALEQVAQLKEDEWIFSLDGCLLSATTLQVYRPSNMETTALKRSQKFVKKQQELQLCQAELDRLIQQQNESMAKLEQITTLHRSTDRQSLGFIARSELCINKQLHTKKDTYAALIKQKQKLYDQHSVLRIQLEKIANKKMTHEARLSNIDELLATHITHLGFIDSQLTDAKKNLALFQEDIEGTDKKLPELQKQIDALKKEIEIHASSLTSMKQEVASAKSGYESLKARTANLIKEIEDSNQQLQQCQLELKGHQVTISLKEKEIMDLGGNPQQLHEFECDDSIDVMDEEITRIERLMAGLGPVNLAAMEEYQELKERFDYLQSQYDDITNFIDSLTQTIAKIDKETNQAFSKVFTQVQENLSEMVAALFEGGIAKLQMSGEDDNNQGVVIYVQPPGKRVTNIQLLSGGEKTMTAIAFVVALFKLNPAPFCLMDEVDAALDDINVERFSALLKKVSRTVQHIVITHHKTTMAAVEQLNGITMNESGVSRVVAVNLQEASNHL